MAKGGGGKGGKGSKTRSSGSGRSKSERSKSARKPRPLSEAYRKRLERGMARGKTRQEARGHRPGEARERAAREREEIGISRYELAAIERFFDRWNPYGWKDLPTLEDMVDFAINEGYDRFQHYRRTWDVIRKRYLRELANKTWVKNAHGELEDLNMIAGAPDTNWLYYH